MRYYSARQRESDLRWDYTCGRNAVGYCSFYREFTDADDWLSESVRNSENAKMIKDDLDAMNFYLGMIYFKQNDFEDGEKCFSLYTEHVKNNPEAYYFRGFCEAKNGKYPEAIKSLKYALMYKDRDWKFYYKMYEVYDALNDKQNALNNISMVIEIGEHKPEYYEIRSKLYTDMGDEYRASEDMAKARELQQTGAATK